MWILTTHNCFEKKPTHGSNVYGDMYATCLRKGDFVKISFPTSSDESLEVERWPHRCGKKHVKNFHTIPNKKKKQTKHNHQKKRGWTWKTKKTTWALGGWCHFLFWTVVASIVRWELGFAEEVSLEHFPKNQICWQQKIKPNHGWIIISPLLLGKGSKFDSKKQFEVSRFAKKNTSSTPLDARKPLCPGWRFKARDFCGEVYLGGVGGRIGINLFHLLKDKQKMWEIWGFPKM